MIRSWYDYLKNSLPLDLLFILKKGRGTRRLFFEEIWRYNENVGNKQNHSIISIESQPIPRGFAT